MSPTATASTGDRPLVPSRRTSASAGARSISARIAPRARSMARVSSTWASANRNTTDAPSAHSPSAIAPATATIIRTWMSRRPAMSGRPRAARRLRPGENRPPRRRAAPTTTGAAPESCSARPERGSASQKRRARSRHSEADGGPWLLVLEPRPHAGLRHGFGDAGGRQLRRVVLDPQSLADDVGVERLEPGERLQPVLEDRDLLVAVHALDLEDRFGVQLADGTDQPWPVTPPRASAPA